MKVKNIESLRKELRRNLDQLYFGNAYVSSSSSCFYDEYDNDRPAVRHLDNVIEINKYEDDNFNRFDDDCIDSLLITVDNDAVHFWKESDRQRRFKLENVMLYDHHSNKSELMMHVTLYITKFLYK